MLTVSLCRTTLLQTFQANFSNKFPRQGSVSCQAHVHTHVGFQIQQSQAMPVLLQNASLLLSSACWPSDAKYTQPFLLCYFTESCSHPSVRASSRGWMAPSEGSKLSITPSSSAAERGFWKYRKNQQAGCTSAAPDAEPKHHHTCLHAKLVSRDACTALQNYLSISSSSWLQFHPSKHNWRTQTLLCLESKQETSYDLFKSFELGRQSIVLEGDDSKKLTSHIWISTGHVL